MPMISAASRSEWCILAAYGRVKRHFLSGSVERASGANSVALPDLRLGAAALAVLLSVVTSVPDWTVIRPVDFLADLDGLSINRDKVAIGFLLHDCFLHWFSNLRKLPKKKAPVGFPQELSNRFLG